MSHMKNKISEQVQQPGYYHLIPSLYICRDSDSEVDYGLTKYTVRNGRVKAIGPVS